MFCPFIDSLAFAFSERSQASVEQQKLPLEIVLYVVSQTSTVSEAAPLLTPADDLLRKELSHCGSIHPSQLNKAVSNIFDGSMVSLKKKKRECISRRLVWSCVMCYLCQILLA